MANFDQRPILSSRLRCDSLFAPNSFSEETRPLLPCRIQLADDGGPAATRVRAVSALWLSSQRPQTTPDAPSHPQWRRLPMFAGLLVSVERRQRKSRIQCAQMKCERSVDCELRRVRLEHRKAAADSRSVSGNDMQTAQGRQRGKQCG